MDKFITQMEQLLFDIPGIMRDTASNMTAKAAGAVIALTPVISGTLKGAWHSTPAVFEHGLYFSEITNTTEYASYVEDGHRVVDKFGNTTGFTTGSHMLKKGVGWFISSALDREIDPYLDSRLMKYFK